MYIQYTCTVLVVPIGTVTNKHKTHRCSVSSTISRRYSWLRSTAYTHCR